MKIEVTQEDINKGQQCSKCYCPIALAINRVLETNTPNVMVFPSSCNYSYKNVLYFKDFPKEVKNFVETFDEFGHEFVKPFNFELD